MMSFFSAVAAEIESHLIAYGVIVIFVIIYFESFGAPLPGETGVIAAGLLAAKGDLAIAPLVVAVLAGAILGDSTGYLIGKFGGRRLLERFGPLVKLTPDRLTQVEDQFRTRGVWLVAVARFLPLMRQINGLVAGTLAMPWHIFLAANAAGAVAWTSVWVLGPFFFAEAFRGFR